MSCDKFKILALTEGIIQSNDKIAKLESTIAECKAKNIDPSLFEEDIAKEKNSKKIYQEVLDHEEKKCHLLKMLQSTAYN